MDDAGLMRSLDTLEHLPEPLRSRLRVKLACAREFQAQRGAANKLHHQVGSFRSDAAVVIDRDDVRMIQAGRGLRLALKAPQRSPVAEHVTEHDLDRDLAIQAQIGRFVNRAHPATADHLLQTFSLVYPPP